MRVLPILTTALTGFSQPSSQSSSITSTSSTPKWYFDVNNILSHKGTPREATTVALKLQEMVDVADVIMVFDGKPGEIEEITEYECGVQLIRLEDGTTADDYICDQVTKANSHSSKKKQKIQIVTADRELRRRLFKIKPVVKGVVNPVTFWHRYLPRLCGYKNERRGTLRTKQMQLRNDG